MIVRDKVERLVGKTLKTLERHSLFDVIKITNEAVIICPQKSKRVRPISLKVIENAYAYLGSTGEITRIELRRLFSPTNSVYVAAILAVLPSVKHSARPIRLRMTKKS